MAKFICLLLATLCALSTSMASCPPSDVAVNLDLAQLSGEWYVVSAMPPAGNSLSRCGRVLVDSTSADKFTIKYTAINEHRENPVSFVVDVTLDDDVTGYWQQEGFHRRFGPYKHRFIDVDYSSHVVMIACGGDGGDVPAPEIAMIWSRAETLPSTVLDRLKDEAGSYVGRDQVIDVDHSNC